MDSLSAFHIMIRNIPIVVGLLGVLSIIGFIFWRTLLYGCLLCCILLLFLFRNPMRFNQAVTIDQSVMIAPADGKIINIAYDADGSFNGYYYKISIMSSLFDVHINRVLSGGIINNIINKNMCMSKNSYIDIVIIDNRNYQYTIRQNAGSCITHLACWPNIGDAVVTGQAYGISVPQSQCDIFLPRTISLCVGVGQYVHAGITKIGCWTT